MELSKVKALVVKVMTIGLFAGAFALAVPARAQAQQFGPEFGRPVYGVGPGGYFAQRRFEREEFLRHEAWVRHERFVRHERWERGFYGGPGFNGR